MAFFQRAHRCWREPCACSSVSCEAPAKVSERTIGDAKETADALEGIAMTVESSKVERVNCKDMMDQAMTYVTKPVIAYITSTPQAFKDVIDVFKNGGTDVKIIVKEVKSLTVPVLFFSNRYLWEPPLAGVPEGAE